MSYIRLAFVTLDLVIDMFCVLRSALYPLCTQLNHMLYTH